MDIKTLLLKSLSLKEPISGCYRIYCDKSCFIVRYVLRGKILNISSIKNAKKRETWSHRVKQKYNLYTKPTLKRQRISNKIEILVDTDSKEVQTSNQSQMSDNIRSTSTQSEIITVESSSQQTIPTIRTSLAKLRECQLIKFQKSTKSCQTNLMTDCKGIQCKQYTINNGTQTDKNLKDSNTQYQNDLNIATMLERSTQTSKSTESSEDINDHDVIIYMLNEIGESVINQSQILNNTHEILEQVKQINQLKKCSNLRKSWRKKRLEYKILSQRKQMAEKQSMDAIKIPTETRHATAQTMELNGPETINNSTQTATILSKPRKLCFLKKQNRDLK